ncbi:MAG: DNA polymerase III subunit beta [Anaerolineae bacterium]
MDLTVTQSTLNRALRLITRIAPTKAVLPILQTVLLDAGPHGLTLTATDGDLGVETTIAAEVHTSGRVATPAHLLGEYIAQLPSDPLRLTLEGVSQRVTVTCGRSSARMASLPAADYPAVPTPGDGWAFDLDAKRLQTALTKVSFAASRDSSRPILTAVLFDFGPDGLTLAAADGLRLARATLPEAAGAAQHLLVPSRAVAEFGRLLGDGATARLMLTPEVQASYLVVGHTRLFTRLVDGRFPDIAQIIPKSWRTRVTLSTASFRQSVRVASLFGTHGDARPVVLTAGEDGLHLQARGDETGEAESHLPATVEGESQAVALNTRLLVDLLDTLTAPQVQLTWASPQSPVTLRELGDTSDNDIFVAMPLHLPTLVNPAKAA